MSPQSGPPSDSTPPLPPGGLVLLVGPPAAGKSTLAAALLERGVVPAGAVLSTDAERERLTGSAESSRHDAEIFATLLETIGTRLRDGATTVVDATNLLASRRAAYVALARAAGRPIVAIRFGTPLAELLRRNHARARRVRPGNIVLAARKADAEVTRAALLAEGFDAVLDADEVLRASAPAPEGAGW